IDVNKCIRLIPPFCGKDVDKYFVLFERVATKLKWPKDVWPLLLQCVFTGKAQEAYAALSLEVSLDYDKVKVAVLRSYELVPKAWCLAQGVKDFDQLRDLIVMEEFKNCAPEKIATHINEHKVTKVSEAAVLADEYVLTHRDTFEKSSHFSQCKPAPFRPFKSNGDSVMSLKEGGAGRDRLFCGYCKKRGHVISDCFLLKEKKNKFPKTVALVKTPPLSARSSGDEQSHLDVYSPFIMKGMVSLMEGGSKVPVTILRDTAASRLMIVESVLPLSEQTSLNSSTWCKALV
ncbi:hypothetical protein LDENG_00236320, partial [Lucifuga dentata]